MRSFSPRVTKLLFGAVVTVGSLTAAAAVMYATPQQAQKIPSAQCPVADVADHAVARPHG